MGGLPAKIGGPNLPQLGFLDLLLGVSLPAHHDEICGTWDLLDLVFWVLELRVQLPTGGPLPRAVCEDNENGKTEGAKESDGQDICKSGHCLRFDVQRSVPSDNMKEKKKREHERWAWVVGRVI